MGIPPQMSLVQARDDSLLSSMRVDRNLSAIAGEVVGLHEDLWSNVQCSMPRDVKNRSCYVCHERLAMAKDSVYRSKELASGAMWTIGM